MKAMERITTEALSQLRLLQLVSPSLPVGALTYSKAIEWAVEAGWIQKALEMNAWMAEINEGKKAQL